MKYTQKSFSVGGYNKLVSKNWPFKNKKLKKETVKEDPNKHKPK